MIVIIMGVSGSGKTTIGRLLAAHLGWAFYDADDFHSPDNIAKMSAGVALSDEDRAGWLDSLAEQLRSLLRGNTSSVLACSALKQAYRQQLCLDPELVQFVYLEGDYELIRYRLEARTGHYMRPDMLSSQFAAIESPTDAFTISIDQTPAAIVAEIVDCLVEPN